MKQPCKQPAHRAFHWTEVSPVTYFRTQCRATWPLRRRDAARSSDAPERTGHGGRPPRAARRSYGPPPAHDAMRPFCNIPPPSCAVLGFSLSWYLFCFVVDCSGGVFASVRDASLFDTLNPTSGVVYGVLLAFRICIRRQRTVKDKNFIQHYSFANPQPEHG